MWRYEQQGKRSTKMPYNPHIPQERAKCNDPTTFSSIEKAMAVAKRNSFDGIGVGIFGNLAGIDIDHCIDDSGKLSPMAQDIMQTMNAYTEISPSGNGLRIPPVSPQSPPASPSANRFPATAAPPGFPDLRSDSYIRSPSVRPS